jgi:hypothetical protein
VPTRHAAVEALMDDDPGDDPLGWVRREPPPRFERRVITITPGGEHPYDEVEWRDAIVVVARGAIELEGAGGVRHVLERPAVLWLAGLPLRALHNPGTRTTVLIAVRRR